MNNRKKVDFSIIIDTILNLFERKNGYYPYTKHIASKIHNHTCASMDITESKLYYFTGTRIEARLSMELKRIFKEKIEPRFIPTGNDLIDHGRLYNHKQIKKECKKKRWQKKLSRHIYETLEDNTHGSAIEIASGWTFYQIIEKYICDLYNIENVEKQTHIQLPILQNSEPRVEQMNE